MAAFSVFKMQSTLICNVFSLIYYTILHYYTNLKAVEIVMKRLKKWFGH